MGLKFESNLFLSNRALTHMTSQSSHESSNQLKIVGEVASGTVAAVSTMYMALENSSKILAKNIANNTVLLEYPWLYCTEPLCAITFYIPISFMSHGSYSSDMPPPLNCVLNDLDCS